MRRATMRMAVVLAWAAGALAPAVEAHGAGGRRCAFIEDTLVPRLVMGVRRLNDADAIDALAVHAEPGGPAVAEAGLFRPLYVVERRVDARQQAWLLVQDGYTAADPVGWVAERHCEPFRSRYAYTFAPGDRPHPADLHDASKEAYERLLAQLKGDAEAGADLVLVRERPAGGPWQPAAIDDVQPFIELRRPADEVEAEYPDTTPTNRFGIPQENRLVHMGAVCGGPVDRSALERPDDAGGLEMMFVVDETESMRPFFAGVADFIDEAGRAAAQPGAAARLGVSYYTDGPPGQRVTTAPLQQVNGPDDAARIGDAVRSHADKLPPGDYANAPERMLEGLRNAIAAAGFKSGSDAFVAVVGDTGHEPADAEEKAALVEAVADAIQRKGLTVFFAHVGRRQTASDRLFEADAAAVREAARRRGVPDDRVVYQPADAATLAKTLGQARDRAAQRRQERLRQVERIKSRTPHTEPGPKLLRQFAAAGLDPGTFDERHLQFYVPARGWLFHPVPAAGDAAAAPQLRELFFLAPPEREAVRALFAHLQGRLAKGESLDHDAAVSTFAAALATEAGTPDLEAVVMDSWRRLPERQRSVGVFLEDVFGLRVKAALPYPAEAVGPRPATADEIATLDERIGRMGRAFTEIPPNAVWFDATTLVP